MYSNALLSAVLPQFNDREWWKSDHYSHVIIHLDFKSLSTSKPMKIHNEINQSCLCRFFFRWGRFIGVGRASEKLYVQCPALLCCCLWYSIVQGRAQWTLMLQVSHMVSVHKHTDVILIINRFCIESPRNQYILCWTVRNIVGSSLKSSYTFCISNFVLVFTVHFGPP